MLTNRFNPDESERFIELILRLSQRLSMFREVTVAQSGVSGTQLRALMLLDRAPGHTRTFTELCRELETSKPNVTSLVRRLEKLGLAERRSSDSDGRVVYITMTPRAQDVVKRVQPRIRTATEGLLELLEPEERHQAATIIQKMLGHLEALLDQNRNTRGTV
jgi:DNA-binding MarR family transcriptional regulator